MSNNYLQPRKQHLHFVEASNNKNQDLKKLASTSSGSQATKLFPNLKFATDYQVQRVGLKLGEKWIIVEYLVPSLNKRYYHKIKLPKFFPGIIIEQQMTEQETNELTESVYEKNKEYFQDKVTKEQLKQLIMKLAKNKKD